jgi:hypothetical protein
MMMVAVVMTDLVPVPVRGSGRKRGHEGREATDSNGKGQDEALGFHDLL